MDTLLQILAFAFDCSANKLHSKLVRKFKGYLKESKRGQGEKEMLQGVLKEYRDEGEEQGVQGAQGGQGERKDGGQGDDGNEEKISPKEKRRRHKKDRE